MKTLIVEDDFTSRLLVQAIISPYGEFHMAVNGKEAMEAVRIASEGEGWHPYDLILLDVMMPEMDGHEVLKQLRAFERTGGTPAGKGVKVIMTTALRSEADVRGAIAEGCDAYLVKPIDAAKLKAHLRSFGLIE
jgi:two-component system, chemotaxis family, chemotaxis protein CheY